MMNRRELEMWERRHAYWRDRFIKVDTKLEDALQQAHKSGSEEDWHRVKVLRRLLTSARIEMQDAAKIVSCGCVDGECV